MWLRDNRVQRKFTRLSGKFAWVGRQGGLDLMARAPAPPAGSLCFQISRDGLAVASCSGDLADTMLAQAGAGSWPGKSIGGMFSAMNKRSLFTLKTQETEKFYNN